MELVKLKLREYVGNFWEIYDEVLNRIEGVNYLENKLKHNIYLKDNPIVAQKWFINIH